jgi:hypothetical protein
VDWHHGQDRVLGKAVLGKAVLEDEPDEEGRWVEVWLRHGDRRVSLIKRLAESGGVIYGSSESVPGMVKKASTGEILVWPYVRQTLSTSPQNTYSVLRPFKATLDDYAAEGTAPTAAFFDDLARFLDDLALGPSGDLTGEPEAKAGRVLAARNEDRVREGLDIVVNRGWDPVARKRAIALFASVLDELETSIRT